MLDASSESVGGRPLYAHHPGYARYRKDVSVTPSRVLLSGPGRTFGMDVVERVGSPKGDADADPLGKAMRGVTRFRRLRD
jgi:hypothetical protein